MGSACLYRAALALHQEVQCSGRGRVLPSKRPSQALYLSRRAALRCVRRGSVLISASKKVLVPIANGSEEIEAVVIIDVLRRAGAEVTVASVEETLQVEMSRKVKLVADMPIRDAAQETYDAIALPGGMPGAERLGRSQDLMGLLQKQKEAGRIWAAICAAPAVVLEAQGWLKDKKATCHPAFAERLADQSEVAARVIVNDSLVTSRGPGTAIEFALALVAELYGKDKEHEVAEPMVMPVYSPAKQIDSKVPA